MITSTLRTVSLPTLPIPYFGPSSGLPRPYFGPT
jgi:hypothetical protein